MSELLVTFHDVEFDDVEIIRDGDGDIRIWVATSPIRGFKHKQKFGSLSDALRFLADVYDGKANWDL